MEEAAQPHSTTDAGIRCPDPTAHKSKNSALQNQASAAALYSINPARTSDARIATTSNNPLGADGKLSSASAATSLKYAQAQDLPSFPSIGIDTKISANNAALLANQTKKSTEWWKPEQSAVAGQAALLANGYKMTPLWQPEASAASSKAAMIAHKDSVKSNLRMPESSAEGNSAANIAMRQKASGKEVDNGYMAQDRKNAHTAAMEAHSLSARKRALSSPPVIPLYSDHKNSTKNALSAATIAHSPSMGAIPQRAQPDGYNDPSQGAMKAARVQHAKNISRDMYTSAPPVALEVDEKKHNDALRASAISMARKMYDIQQQHTGGAAGQTAAHIGATTAHGQLPAPGGTDIQHQAMRYIGVQEAAQKLAQERLAKIEYNEDAAYRRHYGYDSPSRHKFSMRRGRNRAQSTFETSPADNSDSDEDDFRPRRIRSQIERLNKQLDDIDAKRRESDRKSLMAAAQRKVQAQMQGLDQKIFDETGKMSPGMVKDWEEKAKSRALANSEARMEKHGKVHLGHGKWMDQSEIDAIAQARIQPTLDEITAKTEKRFAADEKKRVEEEERRLDLDEKKRHERMEKERRAVEIRAEGKFFKDEKKKAEKVHLVEEKTTAKHEMRNEKRNIGDECSTRVDAQKSREARTSTPTTKRTAIATSEDNDLYRVSTQAHASDNEFSGPTSPRSPQASSKGLKSLLTKMKRRSKPISGVKTDEALQEQGTMFVGGAALRTSILEPQLQSSDHIPLDADLPTDLGDVEPKPAYVPHVEQPYSDVSSLSSDVDEFDGAPRGRSMDRIVSGGTVKSGGTDVEQTPDYMDATLAPPPFFTSDAEKAPKESPNRDSRFHEVGL